MTRVDSQRELDRQQTAGVTLIRQYIWWDRIETSPGTYNWTRMDQLVVDASARGISILPTLLYTPAFYSSKPEGSISPYQFPPADPQKLADFATAMVKRYGNGGTFSCKPPLPGATTCLNSYLPITYWEIWNEPDYPSWWKGAPNAAEYFELLKTVAPAIKLADPRAEVVLGSLTNNGGGTTGGYLEQLYELGAKEYFDLLSLNAYARDVGSMVAFIRGERAVAARYFDGEKPVFITEYGWATGGVSAYIVTDQRCQAALLYAATRRLSDLSAELHIAGASQFQWHDVKTTSATAWPHYAGVYDADDQPKPSLAAYSAALKGEPAPAGLTLAEACPADRQSVDGSLQKMTVTTLGTGSGTVKSSPTGISCGPDCDQEFQPGAVTLTATPEAGSAFDGWSDPTCTGPTCTVTMDSAKDVTAEFNRVATPGTLQQDDPLIAYTGQWIASGSLRDSGGSSSYATDKPATATLRFQGRGVQWVSRTTRRSGIARVFIDGVRVARVDGYSSPLHHRVALFDSGDLAAGLHTIQVKFAGLKRAAALDDNVVLDAFVVR